MVQLSLKSQSGFERFTGGLAGELGGAFLEHPGTRAVASGVKIGAAGIRKAGLIHNVNLTKITQNCVNCASATDATLAGRPVSALPGGLARISVLEKQFGGTFKSVAGRSEIESIVSDLGSGSRGIVFGARGNDVGHVLIVVTQKGTVRFLDGQTGKPASFDGFTSFQFLQTN